MTVLDTNVVAVVLPTIARYLGDSHEASSRDSTPGTGLPIVIDGQVVGGIDASFDRPERDVQCPVRRGFRGPALAGCAPSASAFGVHFQSLAVSYAGHAIQHCSVPLGKAGKRA